MGHKMAGCLLVKLFAMHTTYFCGIFAIGKKRKAEDEEGLRNEKHVADWILVVSSHFAWFQFMKQPTILKGQVKGFTCCRAVAADAFHCHSSTLYWRNDKQYHQKALGAPSLRIHP